MNWWINDFESRHDHRNELHNILHTKDLLCPTTLTRVELYGTSDATEFHFQSNAYPKQCIGVGYVIPRGRFTPRSSFRSAFSLDTTIE